MSAREDIACLGAGRMGRGIAVVFAYAGHNVALVDFKPRPRADFDKLAGEATAEITRTLTTLAKLGLCASITGARFTTTTEVYPDSPRTTAEECSRAQVTAVCAALDHALTAP